MLRAGLVAILLSLMVHVWAAEVTVSFDTPEQSELYHSLLKEYRCLKCQNQNLSDSNASLAGDLRREIRDQILAGNGKRDIDQYLIARYGDFVLYRPPFSAKTAVLWIGPFVLLIVALAGVFVMIRRQRLRASEKSLPVEESNELFRRKLEKAKRLLED